MNKRVVECVPGDLLMSAHFIYSWCNWRNFHVWLLGIFQRLAAQEDPGRAFIFAAKAAVAGAEATKSMPALVPSHLLVSHTSQLQLRMLIWGKCLNLLAKVYSIMTSEALLFRKDALLQRKFVLRACQLVFRQREFSTRELIGSFLPLQAGRSSYVPAQVLATVPDPGAMAAAAWLMAAATAITQDLGIS